jgi:Subtilase family
VHAVVPYDRVDAVAALPWVAAVRPTVRPAVDAGPIVSEGVRLHSADTAQSLGFTGAGQRVGVISDGVTSLAESVARGELPGTVQVLDAGSGDEGTAMLEIINDMAPGAGLAFNTVGEDLTSYVAAFHNLAAAGMTMIAEDIAFDEEPAFQQGLGATTAEQLARSGIWVSSSAGNLGARHAPRGPAAGTGTTPDGVSSDFTHCPTAPRNTVNLRGTDNTYDVAIRPGGAILPTLQWSEPRAIFPTPGQGGFTDLNLYLMTGDGKDCLAVSNAVQADGVGDTIEQLLFVNDTGAIVPAKLVVNVAGTSSATQPPVLDLRWRTAGLITVDPPDRAGSLNPDSNYLGFATSAGAAGANVSTDPAAVPLEPYSAAGPVQIGLTTRCASGSAGPCQGIAGGGFHSFPAPNWTAADGVSVSGVGGFGSGTCPATAQGDCRFFGTSAAAPSAAGVAALLRQQNGGQIAPRQLNTVMSDLAVPRAGFGWGTGVLQAVG